MITQLNDYRVIVLARTSDTAGFVLWYDDDTDQYKSHCYMHPHGDKGPIDFYFANDLGNGSRAEVIKAFCARLANSI